MIEFNAERHEYRVDGRLVPNVTSILAPLYDLDGIPRAVLERKRAIGQAVHRAIELELQDDLDESTVHEDVAPYLPAWRRWRVDRGFELIASERKVAHPLYGYAGTLDLRGRLTIKFPREKAAPGPATIDLKTTFEVKDPVGLQLAAYQGAEAAGGDPAAKRDRRLALQLKPDGTYVERFFDDPKDWPVFLSFLTCHNWKEIHT